MNRKLTEQEVDEKIEAIQSKGIVFYEPLNKNVRISGWSYYIGERKIKLNVTHGFGASEITEGYLFFDEELDDYLSKFREKKKVILKFIDERELPVISVQENIKPKKIYVDEWSLPKKQFKRFNHTSTKKLTLKYIAIMADENKNNIEALREVLFDAIRKLEKGEMKGDDARSMASLAQVIINSAKLQLDYKRMSEKIPDIKMLNE